MLEYLPSECSRRHSMRTLRFTSSHFTEPSTLICTLDDISRTVLKRRSLLSIKKVASQKPSDIALHESGESYPPQLSVNSRASTFLPNSFFSKKTEGSRNYRFSKKLQFFGGIFVYRTHPRTPSARLYSIFKGWRELRKLARPENSRIGSLDSSRGFN